MATKKPKPLSWKARRSGDLYCAPACGGRCTWAAYQKAKKDAAAFVKRLGTGWKARVWENLGWHYEAATTDGTMKVHENRSRDGFLISYTAFFERKTEALRAAGERGVITGNWAESGSTPQEAIEKVLRVAQAEIDTIQAALDSYKATVNPKLKRGR